MTNITPKQLLNLGRLAMSHRRALRLPTHLTLQERAVLYGLAREQAGGAQVCEIGSYLGASACVLAAGLVDGQHGGGLVCVDTWQNEGMAEGKRDTWELFQNNIVGYRSVILPVRGCSHVVVADAVAQAGKPWSLVFFDGDHSEEGVARDWQAYRPHMARGAVVAFHDAGWAEGVKKLIDRTVRRELAWSRMLPNLFWGGLA